MLALHGTPGSRLMFALADRAARDRGIRLIAPERPGYGLSDYRRSETLAQIAEDLSAVADDYGLGRFAVIGVSGGGPYAGGGGRGHAGPHQSPGAGRADRRGGGWPASSLQISEASVQAARAQAVGNSALLSQAALDGVQVAGQCLSVVDAAGPRARSGVVGAIQRKDKPAGGHGRRSAAWRGGVAQDLRLCCSPWRLRFADIDVPTILWQGSDDPVVPPEAAYALARALPNCRLDVIPGAGHYWVFSRFGLILDAVAAVLRADAAAGVAQRPRSRLHDAGIHPLRPARARPRSVDRLLSKAIAGSASSRSTGRATRAPCGWRMEMMTAPGSCSCCSAEDLIVRKARTT